MTDQTEKDLVENALLNFRIAILSVLQSEKYEKEFIDHMCENTYVKKTRNVNGELYSTIEFPDEIEQFKEKILSKYNEQTACDKCKQTPSCWISLPRNPGIPGR